MTVDGIRDHILKTGDLPTLPVVAQQIMSLKDGNQDSFKALAAIVEHDPSLTVKLLGLANSALYGQQSQVASVRRAITLIGTQMLKRLALSAFVKAAWANDDRHEILWKHSIAVAFGTSFMARKSEDIDPDDAFSAGLLHDVGVLVLETILPDAYAEVESRIAVTGSRQEAEKMLLEVDHLQAGAWFAGRWQLPEVLVEGIRQHHSEDGSPVSRMIRVAEQAATNVGMGLTGEIAEEPFESLEEVESYLSSRAEEIDAFFRLGTPSVV